MRRKNLQWTAISSFLQYPSSFSSLLVRAKGKNCDPPLTSGFIVLSLSGGPLCSPVKEEHSSVILGSTLSVDSWLWSVIQTLAVFLTLTFRGLPRLSFFKNSSRTGAHGILSKSFLPIPAVTWLPWVITTNPESAYCGVRVACWDVKILSCSISEGLFISRVPSGLPVLMSCVSPVLVLTSGFSCHDWGRSGVFSLLSFVGELHPEFYPELSDFSVYSGSSSSSWSDQGDEGVSRCSVCVPCTSRW